MFVVKKNRLLVYRSLFREGVLVAKKDFYSIWVDVQKNEAGEVVDENKIPNLEVINLMKSLKSSGYVKETFNWQYYYWYLTAEGLEFLRQYLHIPTDGERAIVPATHKKAPPKGRPGLGGAERQDRFGDKPKRFGEPGGDFKPGFGRGRDNYRSDRGGDRAPFGRGSN